MFKPKIPTEFKGCVKLVKNKDVQYPEDVV